LADALGLPGIGANALLDGGGNVVGDLNNGWDWAKAQLQNIAENAQGIHPGVTPGEILSKGGVFDFPGDEYDGDYLSYRYANIIRTFADPVARTRDSVTGDYYSGVPQHKALTHSDGSLLEDSEFPFRLITYKTVHHGQARTNVNPWLMLIVPENPVEISAQDAASLKIETGDVVKVKSRSHHDGIVGRALVTQRLKPGVIAISHHYGHWEQSSRPMMIDGVPTDFDSGRGAGIQPTQIMRTDDQYPNVSLQEPVGASCSFFDTQVKVKKEGKLDPPLPTELFTDDFETGDLGEWS
jgi:anaerobic selenocysteine-containing dehydrogenase